MKKLTNKQKDRIGFVVGLVSLMGIAWIFASFIDINIHNGNLDQNFAPWNFFDVMNFR